MIGGSKQIYSGDYVTLIGKGVNLKVQIISDGFLSKEIRYGSGVYLSIDLSHALALGEDDRLVISKTGTVFKIYNSCLCQSRGIVSFGDRIYLGQGSDKALTWIGFENNHLKLVKYRPEALPLIISNR